MRSKRIFFTPLLVLVLCSGCAVALYKPTAEHVSPDTTLEELVEGRRLYVSNCSSCHALRLPEKYDEETWRKEIDEMGQRAELDQDTKALILKYLLHAPRHP
ncbi:MAG: hypothetical protein KDC45_16010 [Bacteroidetes bacterium]|nr:hypothetical protein [Bacteroidota bacterium]